MPRISRPTALGLAALFGTLAVASVTHATDLTGGVANLAPTLTSVTLSSTMLSPTAGSTTPLTVTVVAADPNGYNDISTVTVSILKPDGTTTHASGSASLQSGSGTSGTFQAVLSMNYYDPPATLLVTGYQVKVVVADAGSPSLSVENVPTLHMFTYAELAALNAPSSISTGSGIQPGGSSSIATAAIQNYGNVQIDMRASGTAPSHGSKGTTLPISSITYSLNSDMASSSALSGSPSTITTFNLSPGSGAAKNSYWQLSMPSGASQYVPAGTYTSTLTLTAIAG